MRINEKNCVFMMIDIQEKFVGKIENLGKVIETTSTLNKASEIMNIPLIVTEQYPKGLGKTIKNIYLPDNFSIYEKTIFSAMTTEVIEELKSANKKWIVLYGIETHVCLTQTVLDAVDLGLNVMFVTDGISSRKSEDKKIALNRVVQAGAILCTKEMILFELLQDAKHPRFKDISKLIK